MDRIKSYFLLGLLLCCALLLCTGCGKKGKSISGDEVSGASISDSNALESSVNAGEAKQKAKSAVGEGSGDKESNHADEFTVSGMNGPYSKNRAGVDYATGTVVVSFTNITSKTDIAATAKQAMVGQCYFSGSSVTVNDILTGYGQGEWSAIVSPQNDICVWYTGTHGEDVFKVNFVLYEDGTFLLDSVTVNGERVEDMIKFMREITG